MLLEYLIETKEKAESVISLITDPEMASTTKMLTDNHFIVTIQMKSNSEDAAKKLSDVNDSVIKVASPTVLSNGAAAYFNKTLFPLVNDFERKLRKLLYAASALKPDEKDTIEKLEEQDFGKIFDTLFLDRRYWEIVKGFVGGNKKTGEAWTGYSYELKDFLERQTENLLWDRLLPDHVPLLRERFAEIRLKRNDIMHAHNINRIEYNKARRLFEDVNKELDDAIEGLADGALIPDTYNEEINDAVYLMTENGDYITDQDGNRLVIG